MEAYSASAPESDHPGIPLDLEPLLAPHLHHARLSIRVERLPPRARLSKGHNNGDCTFSLKPEELDDLYYVPPDGTDNPHADLAVRIVKLDDDYATTLELIDLDVPSAAPAKGSKKRTIRFSGTPDRRKSETVVHLDTSRSATRAEHVAAPDAASADAAVDTQKLQRAFDVLSQTLAQTEARAADAEKQAEEAEAQIAALAARISEAEVAAESARADAKQAYEAELVQLRTQLDAAATDVDAGHKRALEAAATAHAREVAELQKAHTRELDERISATKKELERALKDRLADARGEAEQITEAQLATARKEWQALAEADLAKARDQAKAEGAKEQAAVITEQLEREFAGRLTAELREVEEQASAELVSAREAWQAEEAERLAAVRKEFDVERSRLRQQLDDAAKNFDEMRQQALDAAAADHAQEIAALQTAHARALEAQIKATEKKLEQESAARSAEALRQSDEKATAELEKARQAWQAKAEAELTTARDTWQAEEAERLASAKQEFDVELSQLRQQLDAAAKNFDEMRQQALDAAAADHAQEFAELQSKHADALEAQTKETTEKLEQEFAERLTQARSDWEGSSADDRVAQALRDAEQAAKAQLEKARQAWQSEAEANLAAAQETWKIEEAERLAAALKVWQGQPQKSPEAKTAWRLPALPRLRLRLWLPSRSLAIKLAVIGALGLGVLHPEVKSRLPAVKDLVAERSAGAATELRIYFDPLISKVTGSDPLPEAMPPQRDDVSSEAIIGQVQRATIGVGRANVRSGPSTGATVIETLARGSELTVLGSQGNWFQVRFGAGIDEVGWVHNDLLGAAP